MTMNGAYLHEHGRSTVVDRRDMTTLKGIPYAVRLLHGAELCRQPSTVVVVSHAQGVAR